MIKKPNWVAKVQQSGVYVLFTLFKNVSAVKLKTIFLQNPMLIFKSYLFRFLLITKSQTQVLVS